MLGQRKLVEEMGVCGVLLPLFTADDLFDVELKEKDRQTDTGRARGSIKGLKLCPFLRGQVHPGSTRPVSFYLSFSENQQEGSCCRSSFSGSCCLLPDALRTKVVTSPSRREGPITALHQNHI